jgi:ubiquinone/menaquinone biosynthesis C-methylase UbiE
VRLNDPELVRRDYADEERFSVRQATWNSSTGPDVHDLVLELLREISPTRVLEVGPGKGELAERIFRDLGADLVAVDQSERMVNLPRARGVHALLGDVQKLPFENESFDACVAAWMLYHVPDLDRGLGELARVPRSGGRLVAVTNSERILSELWTLVGEPRKTNYPFGAENGGRTLRRHFHRVQRHDVAGTVRFSSFDDARRYIASSPTRAHLADELPAFDGPLVATRAVAVFVAEKA